MHRASSPLKKLFTVTLFCTLLFAQINAFSDSNLANTTVENLPGKTVTVPVAIQAWQQRRKEFAQIVQGTREGKPEAIKAFDVVLTEIETKFLHRTPMENLEILGVFYVPKDGIEAALPLIALNAALGWYDALRYASASGKAEIVNNEGFFRKAILLGGPETQKKSIAFLKDNPDKASELVKKGLVWAEKFRDINSYDHKWPTAYGLERLMCGMNKTECTSLPELPQEKWNEAWGTAKQKVMGYYSVKTETDSTSGASQP